MLSTLSHSALTIRLRSTTSWPGRTGERCTRFANRRPEGEIDTSSSPAPPGTGKTHLLIAAARAAEGFYLDPGEPGVGPGVTERLESARLVCLDGIGAAAGRPDWERALFRLFNALESAGAPLVVADRSPPGRLGFALPDLASRLASGPVLRLAALGEPELGQVLVSRARARGIELPLQVAAYLVTRERRDVPHLLALLERLDRHSLAAQRSVTIPFVRSLIEEADEG